MTQASSSRRVASESTVPPNRSVGVRRTCGGRAFIREAGRDLRCAGRRITGQLRVSRDLGCFTSLDTTSSRCFSPLPGQHDSQVFCLAGSMSSITVDRSHPSGCMHSIYPNVTACGIPSPGPLDIYILLEPFVAPDFLGSAFFCTCASQHPGLGRRVVVFAFDQLEAGTVPEVVPVVNRAVPYLSRNYSHLSRCCPPKPRSRLFWLSRLLVL